MPIDRSYFANPVYRERKRRQAERATRRAERAQKAVAADAKRQLQMADRRCVVEAIQQGKDTWKKLQGLLDWDDSRLRSTIRGALKLRLVVKVSLKRYKVGG